MLDDLRLYPRHHSPGAVPEVMTELSLADTYVRESCSVCDGTGSSAVTLWNGCAMTCLWCASCDGRGSQLRHAYAEGSGEQ